MNITKSGIFWLVTGVILIVLDLVFVHLNNHQFIQMSHRTFDAVNSLMLAFGIIFLIMGIGMMLSRKSK